jgi:hypothetical protein
VAFVTVVVLVKFRGKLYSLQTVVL